MNSPDVVRIQGIRFFKAIAFLIICTALFGALSYYRSQWQLEGVFTNYKSMGKPQSEIEKIAMAIEDGVVVKTKDHKYYLGSPETCLSEGEEACWTPFLGDIPENPVEQNKNDCMITFRPQAVPDNAIQSIDYNDCSPILLYDRFALLSDGTISVWHVGPFPDLAPVAPLFAWPYGSAIGFIFGVLMEIIYAVIILLKEKKLGDNNNGKRI
jgi:hypothetical protein